MAVPQNLNTEERSFMRKLPIIWYDDSLQGHLCRRSGLWLMMYIWISPSGSNAKKGINAPAESFCQSLCKTQITNYGANPQPDITYCTVLCHQHRDIEKIIRTLTILDFQIEADFIGNDTSGMVNTAPIFRTR